MLTWYKALYVDEHLKKREKGLKKRLNEGKTDIGHYLITISANPNDYLDIISTAFLGQRTLYDNLPMVVGMASSKKEAIKLVQRIADDCLSATDGVDIRSFLCDRSAAGGN